VHEGTAIYFAGVRFNAILIWLFKAPTGRTCSDGRKCPRMATRSA
jgi:hypothetical protein